MILIDQIVTYNDTNTGDNTTPPGVTGSEWCHLVSDASLTELETFLTDNVLTIDCPATNVRTPASGSLMTYAGLMPDQRLAAITAGASPQRRQSVAARAFDSPGAGSTYEP